MHFFVIRELESQQSGCMMGVLINPKPRETPPRQAKSALDAPLSSRGKTFQFDLEKGRKRKLNLLGLLEKIEIINS